MRVRIVKRSLSLRSIRAKVVRFPISFQIHISCPRPGHSKSARKRFQKLWRKWMAVMMTTLMKWCYFDQPWLFSRGKRCTTWTCRSRWQSWPGRRGRWVRWSPTRCSSQPRSPRTCRSWKRSMIGQILRMWKLSFTLTASGNNSVPIITIQDDDNDYDIHDNYVDADITRRFLSFELCHLYHMLV